MWQIGTCEICEPELQNSILERTGLQNSAVEELLSRHPGIKKIIGGVARTRMQVECGVYQGCEVVVGGQLGFVFYGMVIGLSQGNSTTSKASQN